VGPWEVGPTPAAQAEASLWTTPGAAVLYRPSFSLPSLLSIAQDRRERETRRGQWLAPVAGGYASSTRARLDFLSLSPHPTAIMSP